MYLTSFFVAYPKEKSFKSLIDIFLEVRKNSGELFEISHVFLVEKDFSIYFEFDLSNYDVYFIAMFCTEYLLEKDIALYTNKIYVSEIVPEIKKYSGHCFLFDVSFLIPEHFLNVLNKVYENKKYSNVFYELKYQPGISDKTYCKVLSVFFRYSNLVLEKQDLFDVVVESYYNKLKTEQKLEFNFKTNKQIVELFNIMFEKATLNYSYNYE
jgi:hypothetical protein